VSRVLRGTAGLARGDAVSVVATLSKSSASAARADEPGSGRVSGARTYRTYLRLRTSPSV